MLLVRLFRMPFCRDVELDHVKINLMLDSISDCRAAGGCLLATPEHILSLKLKWDELNLAESTADMSVVLDGINNLFEEPYIDVLDESDELLRHKYQLIYTVGERTDLAMGRSRWSAAYNVLCAIQNPLVKAIMKSHPSAVLFNNSEDTLKCSFQSLRLLPGDDLDAIVPCLLVQIANVIIDYPVYHLLWLNSDHFRPLREDIITYVTSKELTGELMTRIETSVCGVYLFDLYALRGYLAGGICVHCLERRHRVQYGVARPHLMKKRMAVPFQASDTPSVRAEFGHPDVSLLYTMLAYDYDGLSAEETVDAVRVLLQLGPNAQESTYQLWLNLSLSDMCKADRTKLDRVAKLDLGNEEQVGLMIKYFRLNTETIFFWLENILFPAETSQFEFHIVKSPWHLCDHANERSRTMGFSGTNDNNKLMPLQVHEEVIETTDLQATNGKMIDLILQNQQYITLETDVHKEQWQLLLELAIKLETAALLDAGAMLAGINVADAARHLLSIESFHKKSVVYFDMHSAMWTVITRQGDSWPLHCSPIKECDGFVIFDERRCRGADMKLNSDARALLTIGPNMCKDKLMQAAGRLRMLDKGQGLLMTGATDVSAKISHLNQVNQASPLTSLHVLQWVTFNTIGAIMGGLSEWSGQGLQFSVEMGAPHRVLQDEVVGLKDLYGMSFLHLSLVDCFSEMSCDILATCSESDPLHPYGVTIIDDVTSRVHEYGHEGSSAAGALDEECEREHEREQEIEEQVEIEFKSCIARPEVDWNYNIVFGANSVTAIRSNCQAEHVSSCFAHLSDASACINFSKSQVFLTKNFWETIIHSSSLPMKLDHFLKPVDVLLIFPNNDMLLVSEREADRILSLTWQKERSEMQVRFLHLSFLKYEEGAGNAGLFPTPCSTNASCVHTTNVLCAQLFDGDTMFSPSRKELLGKILPTQSAKKSAEDFVYLRGKSFWFHFSDLDKFIPPSIFK